MAHRYRESQIALEGNYFWGDHAVVCDTSVGPKARQNAAGRPSQAATAPAERSWQLRLAEVWVYLFDILCHFLKI